MSKDISFDKLKILYDESQRGLEKLLQEKESLLSKLTHLEQDILSSKGAIKLLALMLSDDLDTVLDQLEKNKKSVENDHEL